MEDLLLIFPAWLVAVLFIGGSIALAVFCVYAFRRIFGVSRLIDHNAVAGFIFATLGVVYAVMLGFMVPLTWGRLHDDNQLIEQEANTIGSLFRIARTIPAPTGPEMQLAALKYAKDVVLLEWDLMASGESSPVVWADYDHLWQIQEQWKPLSPSELQLYGNTVSQLEDLGAARRLRLLSSQDQIPQLLWLLLVVGGIVTVLYACLFGSNYVSLHALTAGALAGLIAFILFLILEMATPYSGALALDPIPINQVITQAQQLGSP